MARIPSDLRSSLSRSSSNASSMISSSAVPCVDATSELDSHDYLA